MPDQPNIRVVPGKTLEFRVDVTLPTVMSGGGKFPDRSVVPRQEKRRHGEPALMDGFGKIAELHRAPHEPVNEHYKAVIRRTIEEDRRVPVTHNASSPSPSRSFPKIPASSAKDSSASEFVGIEHLPIKENALRGDKVRVYLKVNFAYFVF